MAWRDRWCWWRYTYAFQFAHGPLCARHRRDVLRFGHVHLCRSCICLYGAWVLSAVMLASTPGFIGTPMILVFHAVALPVLALSWPPWYGRFPRPARDALRGLAGLLLGMLTALLLNGHWLLALSHLAILLGVFKAFGWKRPSLRARACEGCEELGRSAVCSGYTHQASCIRRYEEAMSRVLEVRISAPPASSQTDGRHAAPSRA